MLGLRANVYCVQARSAEVRFGYFCEMTVSNTGV